MQNPIDIAEERHALAMLYARASEELEDILALKPDILNKLRENVKSDRAAENLWDATELGIKGMRLKMEMNRMKELMNAKSSLLRAKETEYKSSNY